jgi:hypothetical protein
MPPRWPAVERRPAEHPSAGDLIRGCPPGISNEPTTVPVPTRPLTTPFDEEFPPLHEDGDESEGIAGDRDEISPEEESNDQFGDDERPTDPNFDFDLSSEIGAAEPETPHELSLGPEFAPEEEETSPALEDALGFGDDIDRTVDAREHEGQLDRDGHDGLTDEPTELAEDDLPGLDGDDAPDLDLSSFGWRMDNPDETALPDAETAFRIEFLTPDREHCSALAAERGVVAAASGDLFWLDADRQTLLRMGLDGTRISSLALVGDDGETALCVTAFGRLLRRARSGGDVERLVDWRRVAEASGSAAEGLELRGLGRLRPRSLLGRLTSGHLVRSDDMGSTFVAVDPTITALTLSSSGDPAAVITRDGSYLAFSDDGGSTWQRIELASPAREVASGEAPLLAADRNIVVIGDPQRGVVVSADAGRTFRRVAGVSNVTAITAGTTGERPSAFAAVYREMDDRSLLVEIDVLTSTARAIARLELPSAPDAPGGLELGRVERLLWDGERLWAAGGFGLARISAPH